MEGLELIARAEMLGLRLSVDGDNLVIQGKPTPEVKALVEELRQHKGEVLAYLSQEPTPAEIADSVDAALRLGLRLRRGEIRAIRCGSSGDLCRLCLGVPCLGSSAWEP